MSGYSGQHYPGTTLVPGSGGKLIDPASINWLYELFSSEMERLGEALFGTGQTDVHMITHPDWPEELKALPALTMYLVPTPARSEVMNPNWDTFRSKEDLDEDGDDDAFVYARYPRVYDYTMEFTIQHADDHRAFDYAQKLQSLLTQTDLTIKGTEIQVWLDTPFIPLNMAYKSRIIRNRGRAIYKGIPNWIGDPMKVGALVTETELAFYSKAALDDHDLDEGGL